MLGYNFNDIKLNNRYEIIQKIYQNIDINRNYITQVTGLTGSAITKIINSLIKEKYISEKNYFSNYRNRRARYLSICEGSFGVIILYFGRSMITAAIADICGKILYSQYYSITYLMLNDLILSEITTETTKHFPDFLTCLGCIAITPGIGLIDEADGQNEVSKAPFFWNMKKLRDIIENTYHIPFFTDNDCNAALLGEKWFGRGKNIDNVVLYSIGQGIGSAVCIQGKLLRRYHNSSIEIGHVTIKFDGPDCDCGNKGCLELYASTGSWEKRLTQLNEYKGEKNRVEAMFINALQGDIASIRLLSQYAHMVTEGAIILATMFSPEKIIVTTNESDFIYLAPIVQIIKEEMKTRIFSTRKEKIDVEESELRQTSFILGGIAAVLEKRLFTPQDAV